MFCVTTATHNSGDWGTKRDGKPNGDPAGKRERERERQRQRDKPRQTPSTPTTILSPAQHHTKTHRICTTYVQWQRRRPCRDVVLCSFCSIFFPNSVLCVILRFSMLYYNPYTFSSGGIQRDMHLHYMHYMQYMQHTIYIRGELL